MRILLFSCIILSTACHNSATVVYEKNHTISDAVWDINERLDFELSVTDTLSFHNFYVNMRHRSDYGYSNLFVFISTQFPNEKKYRDTIECVLADDKGRWFGTSGSGGVWDHRILFKNNIRFPLPGNYYFQFEQGMRAEHLENVMDVGLRVEIATQPF